VVGQQLIRIGTWGDAFPFSVSLQLGTAASLARRNGSTTSAALSFVTFLFFW